jgi:hypothetical protein
LINQLVQVQPDSRLGAGPGGFKRLERTGYFEDISWLNVPTMSSPLRVVAELAAEEVIRGGLDKVVVETFSQPFSGSGWEKLIEI